MLFIASLRSMCLQADKSVGQSVSDLIYALMPTGVVGLFYLWMRCCASVNTSGLASASRDCPSANLSWASLSWPPSASRGDPTFSVEKSWDCFWRSCFQASISPVTCRNPVQT